MLAKKNEKRKKGGKTGEKILKKRGSGMGYGGGGGAVKAFKGMEKEEERVDEKFEDGREN